MIHLTTYIQMVRELLAGLEVILNTREKHM